MVAYESECTFFSVWAQISLGDVVIDVNYGQGKRNPGFVRFNQNASVRVRENGKFSSRFCLKKR